MLLTVFLAGFDGAGAARIARLLDDCSALGARWRVTGDAAADLWIVDGAQARSIAPGLIEIGAEPPLRVKPAEMPRPLVFAEPLADGICTSHAFDPASMQSLTVLLTRLARWLGPRLAQQALVAQLIASGASFTRSNVIEVRQQGEVRAIVDFEGATAVAADALPTDFRDADWRLRARDAAAVPPGFRIAPTVQVLWQYAQRAERDDFLPARYSRLPIHLRDVPRLPPRELCDGALAILRELAYGPFTLGELRERTQLGESQLRRQLGALYLVRAITCDPGRSRAARERRAALEPASDLSFIGRRPLHTGELTAPGFARPAPLRSGPAAHTLD